MSKGNDKKSKADKTKAKASVSPYKAAQISIKAVTTPFAKKALR